MVACEASQGSVRDLHLGLAQVTREAKERPLGRM